MICLLPLAACNVGPDYHRPSVETPASYKEASPTNDGAVWAAAQPKDDALRGSWWEMYGEPQLNALEAKVDVSNQTVVAAAANVLAAQAMVGEARSQYFPTLTVDPTATVQRSPTVAVTGAGSTKTRTSTLFVLPLDATWQPDLFGRIANTVRSAATGAEASAADLENVRLTVQAEVATDYMLLRGQDSLTEVLQATVAALRQSRELTRFLFETGIGTEEAVAQAETQLQSTLATTAALDVQRAQYEHAIAVLIGRPPAAVSIPREPLRAVPPTIPTTLPSRLLERRPDIAAAERLVAQANAQIGIAKAAYYPSVTLSGSAGLESTAVSTWFTWPARFFSIGPSALETLYDGGLRQATDAQYLAQYDASVATYRQTVLAAFQQVEDNLASLRILAEELHDQDAAVASAEKTLMLATERYRRGLDPYLDVITAQTALLSSRQAAVQLRVQQMTASVALIEALGGGWGGGDWGTGK